MRIENIDEVVVYRDRLQNLKTFNSGFKNEGWRGVVQCSFGSYEVILSTGCGSVRHGLLGALEAEEEMLRNTLQLLGVEILNLPVGDGKSLISIPHPVGTPIPENSDIDEGSLVGTHIDISGDQIPTLENRHLSNKPLMTGDLVKIDEIVHVWRGAGWVALCYSPFLTFNVQV